jgi:hypothetical protein
MATLPDLERLARLGEEHLTVQRVHGTIVATLR